MHTWTAIDLAPKDGTPILTDEGVCSYHIQQHWASPIEEGWYLCDIYGDVGEFFRNDQDSFCTKSPAIWIPLPDLPPTRKKMKIIISDIKSKEEAMTIMLEKELLYKTAYSWLFQCYVKIDHAHKDARGEWIFSCSNSREGLKNHLFRKSELKYFCL